MIFDFPFFPLPGNPLFQFLWADFSTFPLLLVRPLFSVCRDVARWFSSSHLLVLYLSFLRSGSPSFPQGQKVSLFSENSEALFCPSRACSPLFRGDLNKRPH